MTTQDNRAFRCRFRRWVAAVLAALFALPEAAYFLVKKFMARLWAAMAQKEYARAAELCYVAYTPDEDATGHYTRASYLLEKDPQLEQVMQTWHEHGLGLEVLGFIDRNRRVIELARKAYELPHGQFHYDFTKVRTILLCDDEATLVAMSRLHEFLLCCSDVALVEGRVAEALEYLYVMLHLCNTLLRGTYRGRFFDVQRLQRNVLEKIIAVLDKYDVSGYLVEIGKKLDESLANIPSFHDMVRIDFLITRGELLRCLAEPPQCWCNLCGNATAAEVLANPDKFRKMILADLAIMDKTLPLLLDALPEQAANCYHEAASGHFYRRAIPNESRLHTTATRFMLLPIHEDYCAYVAGLTWLNGVRMRVGIERHRLTYGSYPDSLEKLVPEFLCRVPTDPLAPDLRFVYRKRSAVFCALYSVGLDGKDDNGQALLPGHAGYSRGHSSYGDIPFKAEAAHACGE